MSKKKKKDKEHFWPPIRTYIVNKNFHYKNKLEKWLWYIKLKTVWKTNNLIEKQ